MIMNSQDFPNSPLDAIANPRASVASVSSESGILDAFPLPDSIPRPPLGDTPAASVGDSAPDSPADPSASRSRDDARRVTSLQKGVQNVSSFSRIQQQQCVGGSDIKSENKNNLDFGVVKSPQPPPHIQNSRALWWHFRFGHQYGNSTSDTPTHSYNNSDLARPQLLRTHSVSRSWDAGTNFHFPPPPPPPLPPVSTNFHPLSSWQEHVQTGAQCLAENDWAATRMHWIAAATHPWNTEVARLLVQLGINENWFPEPQGPVPNFSLIKAETIRSLTAPITGAVVEALTNYAARLKSMGFDVESLKCYELAGELGSKDAIVTAAQIYSKGGRYFKRDIAKAQRLFERANGI